MESLEQDNSFIEELLTPNGPPTTLRAHVVKILSAGILSGKYKPGDRLNESQIARELNISRIPVREALSQLQEQGLVQNRERRGMFVTNISAEEVAPGSWCPMLRSLAAEHVFRSAHRSCDLCLIPGRSCFKLTSEPRRSGPGTCNTRSADRGFSVWRGGRRHKRVCTGAMPSP